MHCKSDSYKSMSSCFRVTASEFYMYKIIKPESEKKCQTDTNRLVEENVSSSTHIITIVRNKIFIISVR